MALYPRIICPRKTNGFRPVLETERVFDHTLRAVMESIQGPELIVVPDLFSDLIVQLGQHHHMGFFPPDKPPI